jgi:hypothetical protein
MMAALMLLGLLLSNLPAKILMLRVRFMRNFGIALHAGFAKAQGDVIITMDADYKIARKRFRVYII